jgi:dUTP pyrophosphatase
LAASIRYWLDPEVAGDAVALECPRPGDAGFDLKSAGGLTIAGGAQALVSTGLHVAIPVGWVGIVKDRSSVALKGLRTHAGVIDASYRGEIKILMSNAGAAAFTIESGMKVAQLVVVPCLTEGQRVADLLQLGDTSRGANGFGSTGS